MFNTVFNDLFILILHALVFCLHECLYKGVRSPFVELQIVVGTQN